MLSFFTVALIALFVLMTWFEAPAEPLVRHQPGDHAPDVPDAPEISLDEDREAA